MPREPDVQPTRLDPAPRGAEVSVYVDEVFEAIRVLPEAEWPAAIEAQCRGDQSLASQVWELVEGLRGTGADHSAGQRIGRYVLDGRLGTGATATVWKAWDTRLERSVALKLFQSDLPRFGSLRQVLLEARATSDVVSDHVIRIQDVAEENNDKPFIVMELCGEVDPESGRLAIGAPMSSTEAESLEEVVAWMIGASRGIQAAHQQGVFHRDLKPDNVLVRPVSRRAQVTDFGLSIQRLTSTQAQGEGNQTITIAARKGKLSIAGTPVYMAPEAARGVPVHLDPDNDEHRRLLAGIDVYGLGATLYEQLAGRPPFRAREDAKDRVRDILEQVKTRRPKRLHGEPTRFKVSTRLERIVFRALHPDPRRRYRSAGALAEDLEAYLAVRPTAQDQGRRVLAFSLWTRRHWAQVSALGSLLVMTGALGAAGVAALIAVERFDEASRAAADRDRVQAEVDRIRDEADRVRGMVKTEREKARAESRRALEAQLSLADAQEALGASRRGLTQTRAERDQLKGERDELEGNFDELESAHGSLSSEHSALTERHDALIRAHDALKELQAKLSADYDLLAGDHDTLQANYDQTIASLIALEDELDRLKQELADQKRVVASYERQLDASSEVRDALERERDRHAVTRAELSVMRDRALYAEQQLDRMRGQPPGGPVAIPPADP